MPEQESILQLKSEIQTLKIKDEYRSKELDALMVKLSDTSAKLNALSENIGRLLAAQDVNKMTDKEFREEMKILPDWEPLKRFRWSGTLSVEAAKLMMRKKCFIT